MHSHPDTTASAMIYAVAEAMRDDLRPYAGPARDYVNACIFQVEQCAEHARGLEALPPNPYALPIYALNALIDLARQTNRTAREAVRRQRAPAEAAA